MTGPMDRLFGHSAFDFNRDGKISGSEWMEANDTYFEDMHGISAGSKMNEHNYTLDEIDLAGLDRTELEFMDEDERREALEDAGLDPDDFDDF